MATTNSQDARIGRLFAPLSKGELVLLEFSGVESVNEINNFTVKALLNGEALEPNELLGKPMRVELDTRLGTVRHFHQIVFTCRYLGRTGSGHIYEFELRPWIWAMSRRVNARIFHDMTALKIIETVFADYSKEFGASLTMNGSFYLPEMEYVVQYLESDLDFVRRLMEEYGLNFHCKMTETGHSIVLTTDAGGFALAEGADRTCRLNSQAQTRDTENFTSWAIDRSLPSGSVRYIDYDFETPNKDLEAHEGSVKAFDGKTFEVFDYPGRYKNPSDGKGLVIRRAQAIQAGEEVIRTSGVLPSLGAGMMFELAEHPDSAQEGTYCVLSAHHHYSASQYRSGAESADHYNGSYRLCREASPIAPLQKTPKPIMRGPQTAVVTSGADSTIDKYGRILLKFHWAPTSESMYCRVSQSWAGSNWGTIFTPHVGMEVVVEYLDGDPDRPLVVGCVYNGDNMPPWALPDNQLKSGIKTVQDNRLMFDDKDGKEEIEIHARKNLKVTVENDASRHIENDSSDTVDGNSVETVIKDRTVTVKGNEKKSIEGELIIEATKSITLKCVNSKIVMTPTSITIESLEVNVTGIGSLTTKGGKATHKGDGVLIIQAPTVNIN